MDDVATGHVGNLSCIGTVTRHQVDDAGIELFLNRVEALVSVTTSKNDYDDSCIIGLVQQSDLLLSVVDIHFTLAAEWHDKTAHGLLLEDSIDVSISDDQIVLRDAFNVLLCVCFEVLAFFEILDFLRDGSLVLHDPNALFEIVLGHCLALLIETHLHRELSWLASFSLGSLRDAQEIGHELAVRFLPLVAEVSHFFVEIVVSGNLV